METDNKNTKEFNANTRTSSSVDANTSLLDFKSPKIKPIEDIKLYSFVPKRSKKKETQLKINSDNVIDNEASTSKQVEEKITNYGQAQTISNMLRDQEDGSTNLPNNTKVAYVCPLCFKNYKDNNNRILHIKNCATKHKVSMKKLLQAMELQERQSAERVSLGLPGAPVLQSKKRTTLRRMAMNQDPQLQLALALSKSLSEAEGIKNNDQTEQDFIIANTKKPAENITGRAQRKKKQNITSVLHIRSQEERERLLTEKIAEILVDSETLIQKQQQAKNENETRQKDYLRSRVLKKFFNFDNQLWNAAMLQSSQTDYFVKDLLPYIIPNEQKQTLMEDTNESNVTTEPQQKDKLEIAHDSYLDKKENLHISHGTDVKLFADMKKENVKQSCHNNLIIDWRNALNNSSSSDVIIFVNGDKKIWVHKLVFHVRCPNILLDIIPNENTAYTVKEKICWINAEYDIALAFLEFIYCGIIEKYSIFSNNSVAISSLGYLARRYKVKELFSYLRHVHVISHDNISIDNEFEIDEQDIQEIYCANDDQKKFTLTPDGDSNIVKYNNQDIFNTMEVSDNQPLKANTLSLEKYTTPDSLVDRENSISPDIFDDADNVTFNHSDNTKFLHIENSNNDINDLPSPNQCNLENIATNQLLSSSLTNKSRNSTDEYMLIKSITETPRMKKTEQVPNIMVDKVKPKSDLTLFIEEVQRENARSDFEIGSPSKIFIPNNRNPFKKAEYTESDIVLDKFDNTEHSFRKAGKKASRLSKLESDMQIYAAENPLLCNITIDNDLEFLKPTNRNYTDLSLSTTEVNVACNDKPLKKITQSMSENNDSVTASYCSSSENETNDENISMYTKYKRKHINNSIAMYRSAVKKYKNNVIEIDKRENNEIILSDCASDSNNITKCTYSDINDTKNDHLNVSSLSNINMDENCSTLQIEKNTSNLECSQKSKKGKEIWNTSENNISRSIESFKMLEVDSWNNDKLVNSCDSNSLKTQFLRDGSFNDNCPSTSCLHSFELPDIEKQHNSPLKSPIYGSFNDDCPSTSYLQSLELPDIEKQHNSPLKSPIYSNPILISSGSDIDPNSVDNNDFNKYNNDHVMSSKTQELDDELQRFFSNMTSLPNVENEIVSVASENNPLEICRKTKKLRKRTRSESSLPYNYSLEKNHVIFEYDSALQQSCEQNNYKSNASNDLLTITECYISPPNYEMMDTPKLHKEMKKYGLKIQKRQKAIKLLTYIYNELHPTINLYETPDKNVKNTEDNEDGEPQKKIQKSHRHLSDKSNIIEDKCDTLPLKPLNSKNRAKKAKITAVANDNDESVIALNECADIAEAFSKLLNFNKDLYNSILRYEPLDVKLLQCMLKTGGFKCNMNALIDFLDEQCITFQSPEKKRKIRTKKVHS